MYMCMHMFLFLFMYVCVRVCTCVYVQYYCTSKSDVRVLVSVVVCDLQSNCSSSRCPEWSATNWVSERENWSGLSPNH